MRRTGMWSKYAILSMTFIVLMSACGGREDELPQDQVDGDASPDDQVDEDASPDASGPDLILASGTPLDFSVGRGLVALAEEIERNTGGTVEVHLDGTLYTEIPSIEAVKGHVTDIGTASVSNIGAFTDAFYWTEWPFLIESPEAFEQIRASAVWDEALRQAEEDGLVLIAAFQNGANRGIATTSGPVLTLEDIQGMRIRSTASPVQLATLTAWDARPVSMEFSEVPDALRQGVIDGVLLEPIWLERGGLCPSVDYVTLAPFSFSLHVAVMDADRFNSLSSEVQDGILEAGRSAEAQVMVENASAMEEAQSRCEESGVEFHSLSEAQIEEWHAGVAALDDEFREEVPPEFLEEVREIVDD